MMKVFTWKSPAWRLLFLLAALGGLSLAVSSCGGGAASFGGGGGGGGNGGGNGGGGGNSGGGGSGPPPAGETISPSFFGMTAFYNSTLNAYDFPAVPIGRLGHPPYFAWGWIEQSKGSFDFSLFDPYVQYAQQHGIPVVLTFAWTPPWAVADPTTCHVEDGVTLCSGPPANIQDWTDLVTAVVNHYKGQVKYYELWNEAQGLQPGEPAGHRVFWSGTAQQMEQMAAAAYPVIHTDPNAELLTPSTVGVASSAQAFAPSWLASFLQAGGSQFADGGTFHAYLADQSLGLNPYPFPDQDTTSACAASNNPNACHGSILTMIQSYRAVLDGNGMAGKPLFDTEGSWGCPAITDPTQQSAWIARFYVLAASMMAGYNFQAADWYGWGTGTKQPCGVIETDSGSPNQAGIAYEQVYNWLAGSSFVEAKGNPPTSGCSAQGQVWSCELTLPNGKPGLIVWNQTATSSYTPPSQYTEYRDLAGNATSITSGESVSITVEPILFDEGSL